MQRQQILIGVSHRRTALLWAATNRRTRVVELLMAAGADLAAKDNDGSRRAVCAECDNRFGWEPSARQVDGTHVGGMVWRH